MNDAVTSLTNLSYGLAGIAYTVFAFFLFLQDRTLYQGSGLRLKAISAAVLFSIVWSGLWLAYGLTGHESVMSVAQAADVLRYGAWYVFILALLRPENGTAGSKFLTGISAALGLLVIVGVALHILIAVGAV